METQPQQVPNLLERDDLGVKVHRELVSSATQPDDLKQSPSNTHPSPVDILKPSIETGSSFQFLTNAIDSA